MRHARAPQHYGKPGRLTGLGRKTPLPFLALVNTPQVWRARSAGTQIEVPEPACGPCAQVEETVLVAGPQPEKTGAPSGAPDRGF